MKIRTNEYHANSFADGRGQPNLCDVGHPIMEGNRHRPTFDSTLC